MSTSKVIIDGVVLDVYTIDDPAVVALIDACYPPAA